MIISDCSYSTLSRIINILICYIEISWETNCHYAECTIEDFIGWSDGVITEDNPLSDVCRDTHWVYVDYKHMPHLLGENNPLLHVSTLMYRPYYLLCDSYNVGKLF